MRKVISVFKSFSVEQKGPDGSEAGQSYSLLYRGTHIGEVKDILENRSFTLPGVSSIATLRDNDAVYKWLVLVYETLDESGYSFILGIDRYNLSA